MQDRPLSSRKTESDSLVKNWNLRLPSLTFSEAENQASKFACPWQGT